MGLKFVNNLDDLGNKKLVTLVVLQDCIIAELNNSIDIANESQDAFKFILYPETVSVDIDNYKFPSGTYNLLEAAYDLLQKRRSLKKLVSQNLVFITSYPVSDPSLFNEFKGKSVTEELSQCLFLEREDYPFGSIRLISTYIWEHLPLLISPQLSNSPTGRRALEPYLLFMFASAALDILIDISFHEETRGCPFDYCNDVRDIDRSFFVGSICEEHEQFLRRKVGDNTLSKDQYSSFLALLNRAFGRPAKFKWDVAISFAGPERELAKKLADLVIQAGYKPFYDDYYPSENWGKFLPTHFNEIYSTQARYCVPFVSEEYKFRIWPNFEFKSAQSRAVRERVKAYLLPISVNGSRLEGIYEDLAHLDLDALGLEKIAEILIEKLDL